MRFFWGDIHGCFDELKILHSRIKKAHPKATHHHLGDLVDRGPKSIEVIDYVMKYFDQSVIGNHDNAMIVLYENYLKNKQLPKDPNKADTIKRMNNNHYEYLKSLPLLHQFTDINLVMVHAGLYPIIPIYAQANNKNILHLQMLNPNVLSLTKQKNRWFGSSAERQDGVKKTEEESKKEGFVRWYEAYDHLENCIYGHSVISLKPFVHQNENYGKTISLDTGSCFGGFLTAFAFPENIYYQEKCKEYVEGKNVKRMMEEYEKVFNNNESN